MLLDLAFFSALGFPQETADNLASRMNGGASTYKFSFAKANSDENFENSANSNKSPPLLDEKPKIESSYSTPSSPSPTTTLSSVYKLENNNKTSYYMNPSIYNTSPHVDLDNVANTNSGQIVEPLATSLNANLEIKNASNDLKSDANEMIMSLSNVPKENQENLNETTAKIN